MTRPLYRRKRTWSAIGLLGTAALAIHFRTELVDFFRGVGWENVRQAVLASGPLAPLVCMLLLAFFTIFFLPTTLRSTPDPRARGDFASEVKAFVATGIDGLFADNVTEARAALP